MKYALVGIVVGIAACWTSSQPAPAPAPKDQPVSDTPPPTTTEYRATLRIDAQPGGKKLQGVWLEFDGGSRWIVDYRARELWRGFEDQEVIVTGFCYQPFGQAVNATHFRVERMRFVSRPKQISVPYFEIGPAVLMKGRFVVHTFPAGSKLGGSSRTEFSDDAGTQHVIAGSSETLPSVGGAVTLEARSLELNMAHVATTGGPHIWIMAVHGADYSPNPKTSPTPGKCP